MKTGAGAPVMVQQGYLPLGGGTMNGPINMRGPLFDPRSYGAIGDGIADDRLAFQQCADENLAMAITPGLYKINGQLTIRDNAVWVGLGGLYSNADITTASGGAKLLFTGSANSCFANSTPGSPLLHAGMANLSVNVAGTYNWVWDMNECIDWKAYAIRAFVQGNSTGGFRSQKISAGNNSWVNTLLDVQIRVPNASTKRPLDIDWSDSYVTDGAYEGGIGSIIRGTASVKCLGVLFDVSSAWCLTISKETESKTDHQIIGCEIELGTTGGLLLDGDANDSLTDTWLAAVVVGNHFRNPSGIDVKFQNATGPSPYHGGTVTGNSMTSTASTPISIDLSRWQEARIGGNTYVSALGFPDLGMIGSGSPESVVTAAPGSMYSDATNGELYVKKTGTGNTGWKIITHA